MFLSKLRNYIGEFRAYNRERNQVVRSAKIAKDERLKGRIVRLVHSIEKGLSIDSPRAGFGYDKIQKIYAWAKEYLKYDNIDKTCIYMFADALKAYMKYHEEIGFTSDKVNEIKAMAEEFAVIKDDDNATGVYGGIQKIYKKDAVFDNNEIERLFKTRHSIRQFEKGNSCEELIHKAIELAQCAPSACNRQAVRSYVVDTQKFIETYPGNLQGVGGFVDSSEKVILITGKISPYEEYEYKQFIVSAGIFTGYLDLALHAVGLGSCVVQRSLRPEKVWIDYCKIAGIPMDEQIICMMIVGHKKEETIVPVSRRFDTDEIVKFL